MEYLHSYWPTRINRQQYHDLPWKEWEVSFETTGEAVQFKYQGQKAFLFWIPFQELCEGAEPIPETTETISLYLAINNLQTLQTLYDITAFRRTR